jgi:hypothetical protein
MANSFRQPRAQSAHAADGPEGHVAPPGDVANDNQSQYPRLA